MHGRWLRRNAATARFAWLDASSPFRASSLIALRAMRIGPATRTFGWLAAGLLTDG